MIQSLKRKIGKFLIRIGGALSGLEYSYEPEGSPYILLTQYEDVKQVRIERKTGWIH